MFHFRKPDTAQLARLHAEYREAEYSYASPGFTREPPPPGFVEDHNRIELGTGPATFRRAKAGLVGWQNLQLGWVLPCFPQAALQPGELVGTLARALGTWVSNVCRIVYTIDEPDRFGYAYGTLVGHVEQGEERFLIERDAAGRVWYEIRAYSRPGKWITWLGYPAVRRFQRRFAHDSKSTMLAWCAADE